ncbi:glutamate-cysteine ligase family protein [Aromatoleum petrolei]|uniref:Glutamate--cysteine ligase n=1 Tax=Aromatoleum petrolei TaxID=76116 RepID=A0ABX1MM63_9RHOO|nr:glutamate-cysteine ligase family protein [Aromatoleum petrolei]NMF87718.1 glutamate--cysteine ligase [Aromatoleum petrolei]QTQ38206.1 Glutamate--cysteine ligase [Aromatoleum petrolei]
MNSPAQPLKAFSGCGIELEYMIVDRDTLAVLPIADRLLRDADGGQLAEVPRGEFAWSNELVLHLVELKNVRPSANLDVLGPGFQAEIRRIDAELAHYNARLMPTAMHPWMDPARETRLWPHDNAAIYRSYDRIFDCRQHGWANLQSMHVNLPFAGDTEFARLHAAVRVLLPLLPALAASSAVADGRRRHELDFRMESYRFHPRRVPSLMGSVIPDNASSRAEYEAKVLAPMYRDIAPLDIEGVMQHEWLNTRAAIPRFDRSALEIRIIDLQECPQADLAIAAATTAVAQALFENRWSSLAAQQAIDTATLAAMLLDTIRDADRAVIADPAYLRLFHFPHGCCEVRELWRHLLDACAGHPLLTPATQPALDTLLNCGPLARRILAAVGEPFDRERLAAVYRELCDCLAAGRLFAGNAR